LFDGTAEHSAGCFARAAAGVPDGCGLVEVAVCLRHGEVIGSNE
jgi:hypothetical protein